MADFADDDPDKLNPTVVRLSKELREEKANARWLKKNCRQSQSDHQVATVEVLRLTKELDMTKRALSTEQEIAERLQDDLVVKQAQFVKSDTRAGFLSKDLLGTRTALEKLEVVEKSFAKDLITVRKSDEAVKAEARELASTIKVLKHDELEHKDKLHHAQVDLKEEQRVAARWRKSEQEARAAIHELARQQGDIVKNADEADRQRKDIEAYAHRMRQESETAQKKLKEEMEHSKELAGELKATSEAHSSEREMGRRTKLELQAENKRTLDLRKDKSDAERVAIGVKREHTDMVKVLGDRDEQIQLSTNTIDGRMADIKDLRIQLKDREATVKQLTAELEASKKQARDASIAADTAKKDWKRSADEALCLRKEASNDRNASLGVAREVQKYKHKLKASDIHSAECAEVVERLSGDIGKRQQKKVELEAAIMALNEEVSMWKHKYHDCTDTISTLQGSVKAVEEEVSMTRRTAKDSQTAAVKVASDIGPLKISLRHAESENVCLEQSLGKFRNDLVKGNIEVEAQKVKNQSLEEELKAEKAKIGDLKDTILEQKKRITGTEEREQLANRHLAAAQDASREAGRELGSVVRKRKEVEADIPEIVASGQRALHDVEIYKDKLAETTPIIEQLKKEAAANLKRALAAEALNTGQQKLVTDLEEAAAHAKSHDSTGSALTAKMATRLYEAQKQLPSLEQEVVCYKEIVERMVGEMNALKEYFPIHERDVKQLKGELGEAKQDAQQWQSKVQGFEIQISPLTEQLRKARDLLREEQTLKQEMVKEVHRNRKRTADAEQEASELANHVQRLIAQLQSEGSDPKSPKSPKSLSKKKSVMLQSTVPLRGALATMKGSSSLPAIGR